MKKEFVEEIQTHEEYPLQIKPVMDKAEERMTRKVQNTFSSWNYDVMQWALGIVQDVQKQNTQIKKSADKIVITEGKLAKELKTIIKVEDFLVDNDLLTSSMIAAVGYSFDELAIEVGSRSMATAILAAMNLSFNIQYDMPLYNRILAERKEWLAEKLYDTTIERIPEIISKGINKGLTIDEITELLQDVVGVDKERAGKIARTETNYSVNEAIRQQTHELGITKYRISTAVDACDLCHMYSNTEYTYEQAFGLLPLHPNCRCVLQSVIPTSWLRLEKSLKEKGLEKTISKGYIPIKGIDYFTTDEVEEFKKSVTPTQALNATENYIEGGDGFGLAEKKVRLNAQTIFNDFNTTGGAATVGSDVAVNNYEIEFGSSGSAKVDFTQSIDLPLDDCTFMFWFRPSDASQDPYIFSDSSTGHYIRWRGSLGALYVYQDASHYATFSGLGEYFSDGVATHIAFVMSDNKCTCYVNGYSKGESATIFTSALSMDRILNGSTTMSFRLNQIRQFNKSMIQAEIWEEMYSEYAVNNDNLVRQYNGKHFIGTAAAPTFFANIRQYNLLLQ